MPGVVPVVAKTGAAVMTSHDATPRAATTPKSMRIRNRFIGSSSGFPAQNPPDCEIAVHLAT